MKIIKKEPWEYLERSLSKPISYSKKVSVLIAAGHPPFCVCCGNDENLTFDHIIPVAKGGGFNIPNGQILCQSCNVLKGDDIISLEDLKLKLIK